MKKKYILLAGATGYLGRFIASELHEQDYSATILVRDKNKFTANFEKFKTIVTEVTKPEMLQGIDYDLYQNNPSIPSSSLFITKLPCVLQNHHQSKTHP